LGEFNTNEDFFPQGKVKVVRWIRSWMNTEQLDQEGMGDWMEDVYRKVGGWAVGSLIKDGYL
jgi:hypothetical protein